MPVAKKTATPAKKATPAKSTSSTKSTSTASSRTPAKTVAASTRSKAKSVVEEEEPDLLADLNDEPDEDNEEIDLLDGINEDNGDAWTPHQDDDIPEGIQGRVLNVTYIETDQKYGGGEVPMLEIEEKDGHVWSVRAYHSVLRNHIEKHAPEVGDLVAIKYLGEKENKKGDNSYQNYGMSCPDCVKRKRGK